MTELDVERLADMICRKISMSPRWLKLTAASSYAAMNKHRLIRLAVDGLIIGYQDSERGDWIFDRNSIDEYRLKPVQAISKVKSGILKSLR